MAQRPNLKQDSRLCILVVDDYPGTAETLARALSKLGPYVDVIPAHSGYEAWDLAEGKTVDILVTDMVLPGMNGLELIEKMHSHPGGRPKYILLITAYNFPGLRETAQHLKVNETIFKPFRPEYLCQIVRNKTNVEGSALLPVGELDCSPDAQ